MTSSDRADKLVEQWKKEKPELEHIGAAAIVGRFALVASHLEKQILGQHKKAGLGKGDFDVLATLRRAGEPYLLSPTELYKSVMLTSGAMTNRIDRLENKGWIERVNNPNDRRSTLVQLTEEGCDLIDEVIVTHMDLVAELLLDFNNKEQRQLDNLLRKWVSYIE